MTITIHLRDGRATSNVDSDAADIVGRLVVYIARSDHGPRVTLLADDGSDFEFTAADVARIEVTS